LTKINGASLTEPCKEEFLYLRKVEHVNCEAMFYLKLYSIMLILPLGLKR